jgi:bacterioferritin-associated ferredoxin
MENKKISQSKDRQIATQSSLRTILDWANSCGKCLTMKELMAMAVVLVDFVENGYSKELGDRAEKIQEHLDHKK